MDWRKHYTWNTAWTTLCIGGGLMAVLWLWAGAGFPPPWTWDLGPGESQYYDCGKSYCR